MHDRNSTGRLTDREKDCLRLWLDHKTAKEIARELGISHHAVEKRLKSARTKLNVLSSREAARMLAEAEAYGQAVNGSADLQSDQQKRRSRQPQPLVIGGIAMCFATLLSLALAPADPPAANIDPSAAASAIEIDTNPEPIFNLLDHDASGFLEDPESPFMTAVIALDTAENGRDEEVSDKGHDAAALADFYSTADINADGRISFREFHAWHGARLASMGIKSTGVIETRSAPES
ncbi:hypothetical protein EH32_06380 [Erythrobacter litoralis]|jgi:DNA-binding CsgD family transcriptional regulator|uniref:HTH luxR-type domain-containing protein n=1 Tax=Erythrobacter litoralis TaxID=39960 RepID=A0A074MZ77_9SPHN|nr:LuxR C-terminal-related transcriptional regulator [Erythrobacter litoralis]KEO98729.1 hypothetical protein EH32_06380 [Erythrobacter litoralis]MEE4339385.1 LuxR C-terminal-related transcriptional regulator [Erythrobacter sp.]